MSSMGLVLGLWISPDQTLILHVKGMFAGVLWEIVIYKHKINCQMEKADKKFKCDLKCVKVYGIYAHMLEVLG